MSKSVICRICLRTDVDINQNIEEKLIDFHDEISEYAIYENSFFKYCSVCEYDLRKFYNFSHKCRKANKILKEHKLKKKLGFPANLHELLPQTSLAVSLPSTFRQFDLINGVLEPLTVQIKQEPDSIENEFYSAHTAILPINDIHANNSQNNASGSNYFVTLYNVSDIFKNEENQPLDNVDLENEINPTETIKLKDLQKIKNESNQIEVKYEEYEESIENDLNENSSDTEMIKEFKKKSQVLTSKSRVRKKASSSLVKHRLKQPLKNRKEYENVFDIQLFATEQEAKDELEQRKTLEPYLSAEHKCAICYTVYKYAKLLEFHMRWHDPSAGEHKCDICHMRFRSRNASTKHKYSSHNGKFKCKKCHLVTYHTMTMETHYQQHAGVTFACKHCDHTFRHCSTYKTHLRLRHKTEHVCVTCARTFVSEKGLNAHRNMKHKTKSIVDTDATAHCAPCGLTFANEQVYTVHIKNTETHKDLAKTIIACKLCGIRFEEKEDLKDHTRSQHPKYPSQKPINSSVVRTRTKTPGKDSYKCSICGLVGSSRIWVFKHVAVAHPDSPYVTDLAQRRKHMCETCGKCYTTIYSLRDHINTHTGDKPYSCASCPARFTSRVNLKIHAEWHAPAKRECSHCGKKFVTSSSLSNHIRSHIQDRRYKCALCHKGFLHASTLREHVSGVHNNLRRVRKLAKRESSTKDSLRRKNDDQTD